MKTLREFTANGIDYTQSAMVLFALLLALLAVAPGLFAKTGLPEGKGKNLVERICLSCHEPEKVTKPKLTKAEWKRVVHNMAALGAVGTAQEFETVVDYLSTHFGKASTRK